VFPANVNLLWSLRFRRVFLFVERGRPSSGAQGMLRNSRPTLETVLFALVCLVNVGCNGISSASSKSSGDPPPATFSISGTISPASNGNGATVTLSGAASATAQSDASGNYTFSGLANGAYTVGPSKSGFAFNPTSRAVTVSSANIISVNFTASPSSSQTWSISGTISPATNATGVTLTLSGAASASTLSDASGNYTFSGLANGAYAISASKSGFSFNPTSQVVTVNGANATNVNFTASPSSSQTWSISGTINPAANAPGVTLTLSGAASATTVSDSAGNYNFAGLSNGSYTVSPSSSNFDFTPSSLAATVNGANVTGVNFTATSSCVSGNGSADFYVATNGNDAWSGALDCPNSSHTDGPFRTISKAQQAVQSILQNPQGRSLPIVIQPRAGIYFQTQPLSFTVADSGTSGLQVIWQNYGSEGPVISGGVQLTNWTNKGGNQWQTTLPANTQYFEQLFYNGQRRLRPRLGSGATGSYFRVASTVYLNAAGPPSSAPDPNCSVYVTGSGWECFDRFQYSVSDPISAAWQNLAPPAGNACGQAAGNPNLTGDIELYIFEYFNVSKLRVSCVDATNHIVYLTGPTQQNSTANGFIPAHRYLVENIKDELTQSGQWFLDRSSSPWTLTYLANSGENPNIDTVIVPQASQVLIGSGLQWVTFQGLTFANDNFTVPAAGYPSPQNDATMTAAVSCTNCQNVTFSADTITQTSGGGVQFYTSSTSATTSHNIFENGAVYDVGGFGIGIGLLPAGTDTDSNVAQFTTIQNNVVAAYGRAFPAAVGIMQGGGHDNTYTQNDVYDGYHTAIRICNLGCFPGSRNSHGAFNNTVSFNHIYNIMQGITDDGGAVYLNTGNLNFAASGNQVLNNKVHDVSDASALDSDGYGGEGIYLDMNTAVVNVENNLVYRVSGVPMFVTSVPPAPNQANTVKNNIFAFGRSGMIGNSNPYPTGSCPASPITAFNATNNILYFDREITANFTVQRGCSYSCGFPYAQFQNWQSNLYWRTNGSFASDSQAFHEQPTAGSDSLCNNSISSWNFLSFNGWQGLGEDTSSVVTNPGFSNPAYPSDDYTLTSSPGAGFTVFDPSQAGRTSAAINPPAISATFPTAPFNPGTDF